LFFDSDDAMGTTTMFRMPMLLLLVRFENPCSKSQRRGLLPAFSSRYGFRYIFTFHLGQGMFGSALEHASSIA
jgi:hypothetical protein